MISNEQQEKLATTIALKIIKWQSGLATTLNNWINRFPKKQQQWLLAVFCTLSGAGLILCLIVPSARTTIKQARGPYQPAHIGLPSGQPKLTDSLTLKK